MKTMELADFKKFVNRKDWTAEEIIEIFFYDEEANTYHGISTKVSVLEGVIIIYQEGFRFVENNPSSLETAAVLIKDPLLLRLKVLEEGEKIDTIKLWEQLPAKFSDINYSKVISPLPKKRSTT